MFVYLYVMKLQFESGYHICAGLQLYLFLFVFILSVGLSDAEIAWTVGSSVAVGMVTDYLSLKNSNGWSDAKYIQGDGLSDAKSMV
jgi:hypothetical protein